MALAGLALHGWVVRRPGLPGDVIRWAARLAGWPGRRAGPRWARLLGGLGPDQMALALTLVLGLAVVVLAGLGVGALVDDVTEGDGVAALGHPVARFVAAHRSAARTSVMKAVSVAGGPAWDDRGALAAGLLLSARWRSRTPVMVLAVTAAGGSRADRGVQGCAGPGPSFARAGRGHRARAWFPVRPRGRGRRGVRGAGLVVHSSDPVMAGRIAVGAGGAMLAALAGLSRVYLGCTG